MVIFKFARSTLRPLQNFTNFQTINLNSRTYARWVSRKPVAIVNEDELFEPEDTTAKRIRPRTSRQKLNEKKSFEGEQNKTSRFTILKDNDSIITSLMTTIRSRKRREKNQNMVLEGHRLIKEGLRAGVKPIAMLFNNPSDLDELDLPNDVKLYKIPYKMIQLWSSLTTSPGLIGIFKMPDISKNDSTNNALPITVICDNIREPGNLGSILRAAAGVGCEKLILLKGCVDLWDPKVIRSAAGAHFQIPIHAFPVWDDVPSLISENSNIFVADSNFGDEFSPDYSPEVLQLTLNIFNLDPDELKANFGSRNDETKGNTQPMLRMPSNKRMMKTYLHKLPIVPYYALDYTKKEIVLVLSGETEGLSYDSCKVLNEQNGIRIHIPLANNVDSLNTGVALGIVAFEMKRQFLKRQSDI